jgi:hypothetical protein
VELVLAVLAVLALMTCSVIAAAVLALRAARRAVAPAVDRAGVALRARSGGHVGEVARLRRDIDIAVRRGRRSLAVARAVEAPVGDVPALLDRIEAAARDLDAELRAVGSLADPARAAALLAGPRHRTRELVAAADDVAEGIALAAAPGRTDIAELRAACTAEAEALREGARVRTGRPGLFGPA